METGLFLTFNDRPNKLFFGQERISFNPTDQTSTLNLTLPKFETQSKTEFQPGTMKTDPELKNIKILVVEDIALNQLLMKAVLDGFGFDKDIAGNGRIAIQKLESEHYDLILMDLQMPVMNGFETTEHIRKILKSDIPIIALTADVTTVDLAKCQSLGMDDYIPKPIDETILYNKIINFVRKAQEKKSKIKNMENKDLENEEIQKSINLDYLSRLTKSNPLLIAEMISVYLKQTPPLVQAMRKALQIEDWATIQSAVHKISPSFSIMGIDKEADKIVKRIQENAGKEHESKEEFRKLVEKLEKICSIAHMELEEELNKIKK